MQNLLLRTSILLAMLTTAVGISLAAVEPDPDKGAVNGFIEDTTSKETLVGATVTVKGTKLGAYTNKSGYFSISNIPAGDQTIVISSIGYLRKELKVRIEAGSSVKLRVQMVQSKTTTKEVLVSAERAEDKRQISISQVNIPMEQLSQIRIGGEADIFRALQMLPGVLSSSQISSGLYIRGGSPDQNLVLLDGMTVYNPTHLFGFISAFNNDAVKDVDLIKGGFPAEYGGRMSAVLNITQKDGNRDHVEGLVGIGLISSRASLQGPLGNGSWFIGGRATYLDLLLGLLPEDPESPFPNFNFYDVNAKLTQNLSDDDKLSISGFLTRDKLNFEQPGLLFNVGIGNRATSLRWSHIYASDLFSVATVSASRYDNGFDGNQAGFQFAIDNSITDYSLKTEFEWFTAEDLTFKFGYEGTIYNFTYEQNTSGRTDGSTNNQSSVFLLDVWDNIHSVFAQNTWNITDAVSLQSGLRANYWSKSEQLLFDPRLALRFQLTDGVALKAAWGIYHQYLRLASAPDFTFFDTWLPTDNTVPAGRADHYIVAVETQPFEGFDFNVDVYYKKLYNINELRQNNTQARKVSDVFYIGNGETYGAEFFLQKKMGQFTGWIGYALGFVYSQFDSINQGVTFRPKFDRRHDLKITGLFRLNERWEFGASFMFQSGQSYTGATSSLGGRMPGWEGGIVMVNPSQRWGLRLPSSHQLNLNVNYNTTLFDLPFRIFLDVFNVYSRRDIWFRFYDTTEAIPTVTDVRLLPILPTISFELKF
ncbi:MAG: TonB-dependent receptor [Ignavibacteria bacterium]|nr:TonB-dependent receptor [Ignavibacteria bacterium]MBP6510293.1 TonB-dependent receptor [Candidatus Kapabacteria bacterium]MBK6418255.1 TonB-dependent receptor [Ignavibacteria bacterium]MBK6761200.1 TonB-dependent receptor [Ignavibacteria bacterium]MBK7032226.1 TonB-dependent receptor [Ignavibacteria bacterium]